MLLEVAEAGVGKGVGVCGMRGVGKGVGFGVFSHVALHCVMFSGPLASYSHAPVAALQRRGPTQSESVIEVMPWPVSFLQLSVAPWGHGQLKLSVPPSWRSRTKQLPSIFAKGSSGMPPESLFAHTAKYVNAVQFVVEVGTEPLSTLLTTLKYVRLTQAPISPASVPMRLLSRRELGWRVESA